MLNKKIVSVLAVILMLTMGVGVAFVGNDESEAVTTDTITGSIVARADDTTSATYYIAAGTYINISVVNESDVVCEVESVSGTLPTGVSRSTDSSGYGYLRGTVGGTYTGTFTATIFLENEGASENWTITFIGRDTTSSSSNPFSVVNMGAYNAYVCDPIYAYVGATVNIADQTVSAGAFDTYDVTSGYGLSVTSSGLSGTISAEGTITVGVEDGASNYDTFTIIAVSTTTTTAFRMIAGEVYSYTPTFNISGGTLSLTGTGASYASVSGGTVTFTAPTPSAVGTEYTLNVVYTTTSPSQTITQIIVFTVDPVITVAASSNTQSIAYESGTLDIISSNFEDGTRSIYTLTGTAGYTVNSVDGVITYTNPNSGTVTITASSPYTYNSGATNSASTTITFDVQGRLSASTSGTLYLVTGKTVPNTPAEAVTLNHNDVGTGTYTWAVVGTNNSGVTVASDGTLGGTPGSIGTYAVTVQCTSVVEGVTQIADATLNIVIVAVLLFTSTPSQGTVR